ncbi:MAG: hypothetical protein P0S95_04570 [Rhabdochlamydiaceae bacterium]|nr:hypothetical protein [Candidatus Amphrikana amoebophyrae]
MPDFLFILIFIVIAICYLSRYHKHKDLPRLMNRLVGFYFMWCVGFIALLGFICHMFYPAWTAQFIGWPTSPFQREIALANLAVAVGAFFAFGQNRGYRWGVFIGYFVFYFGAGINHIVDIFQSSDHSTGNAGYVLYLDLIMPVVLLILMLIHQKSIKKKT